MILGVCKPLFVAKVESPVSGEPDRAKYVGLA